LFVWVILGWVFLVVFYFCFLLSVFFLAIIAIRQQRKKSPFPEKMEEFRENIVRYDDEGGGEEDTEAFDISALRTRTVMRLHKPRKKVTTEIHSLYRQSLQVGPDSAIFRQFISEKLEEANTDPCAPPYDSLQTYAFEGTGSLAGSLSSLGSNTSDTDQSYDYLTDWGPRFKHLAGMYASQRSFRD
ncbi:CAD19 protein, partial [Zapornia atra]|nr:CAD19 protein [Zapornia atra]